MSRNQLWVWRYAIAVGFFLFPQLGNGAESDLEGSWLATSMEVDGNKAPNDAVKRMRFRFEGKKLFVRGNFKNDDREMECTFSIDNTKKPNHLDFKPIKDEKSIHAIFERKGKTLKVCVRHSGSDKGRPTEFKTSPNSDLVLIVFRLEEKQDSQ